VEVGRGIIDVVLVVEVVEADCCVLAALVVGRLDDGAEKLKMDDAAGIDAVDELGTVELVLDDDDDDDDDDDEPLDGVLLEVLEVPLDAKRVELEVEVDGMTENEVLEVLETFVDDDDVLVKLVEVIVDEAVSGEADVL